MKRRRTAIPPQATWREKKEAREIIHRIEARQARLLRLIRLNPKMEHLFYT